MRRAVFIYLVFLACFQLSATEIKECAKSIEALERVEPQYPRDVMEEKEFQYVLMSFLVGLEGKVSDVNIFEVSNRKFARPAIKTIQKWLFKSQLIVFRHEMKMEWVLSK